MCAFCILQGALLWNQSAEKKEPPTRPVCADSLCSSSFFLLSPLLTRVTSGLGSKKQNKSLKTRSKNQTRHKGGSLGATSFEHFQRKRKRQTLSSVPSPDLYFFFHLPKTSPFSSSNHEGASLECGKRGRSALFLGSCSFRLWVARNGPAWRRPFGSAGGGGG